MKTKLIIDFSITDNIFNSLEFQGFIMQFTIKWLKDFLDFNENIDKISQTLTSIGLEVEEIKYLGEGLENFKLAKIINFQKHPDADKLNICKVKTEEGELQIVCGAPNVKSDMNVILAPLGSIVPSNQMKVKKVKIRGVESCGMLCSISELNLGDDHEGIIEIQDEYEIGTKATEIFNLDDYVIEIAITPNRGDCISVYGIARDLAAAGIGRLKTFEEFNYKADFNSKIKIKNHDKEIFKQFNLIEIENVTNTESPSWLKDRLKAVGISSKNALVDITNYICISYGQPLHCYDKSKINGDFELKKLDIETKFSGLDDKEYNCQKGDIVICDQDKILALAGILGSSNSGCDLDTKDIYLEAAEFDHIAIARCGRKHQIHTDSRFRFERQIDSASVEKLQNLAANLILKLCGGKISNKVSIKKLPQNLKSINLNLQKIEDYLGIVIDQEKVKQILKKLNFKLLDHQNNQIQLEVPAYRNDIETDFDLIEEIVRIYGMDKIPEQKFSHEKINHKIDNNINFYSIKQKLVACGLYETVNFPFLSSKENQIFNKDDNSIQILNPINEQENEMRRSLIPALLKKIENSQKRNLLQKSFFEVGNIYFRQEEKPKEVTNIAIARCGKRNINQVNNESSEFDLFDVKNDIEAIIETLNIKSDKLTFKRNKNISFLHPMKSFEISYGQNIIGLIGEIHPNITKKFDIKGNIQIAEINITLIKAKPKKKINFVLNDLQAIERDLAFIMDQDIIVGDVKNAIFKQAKDLISDVIICDIYQGEKIAKNTKSVAFNIKLQPKNANLTANEIDVVIEKIIQTISTDFNCNLRS